MKIVLKTLVAAAATTVMLTHNVSAQYAVVDLAKNNSPRSEIFTHEQKDKDISDINPRAVKDFEKSFKEITNEQWSRLGDGYIVSFIADSVRTRVGYNLKGSRQYTLRYYSEKKLPREVRSMVKSVYYDYSITNVVEVDFDNQPVYLVYMQDETHLKTIGVYDGEIKEINNYTRV